MLITHFWGVILCLSCEQRNSAIDEFSSNICELVFYAILAKDKFSIIDVNVRRSSRTFGVRQECSVFQEEHRIRARLGILRCSCTKFSCRIFVKNNKNPRKPLLFREAFGQELTILQSKHFRMAARYYLLNEGSNVIRERPR